MPACPICQKTIENNTPAVQLAGGFFQQDLTEGPAIFVPDDDVLGESFIHKGCLDTLVSADVKLNRAH